MRDMVDAERSITEALKNPQLAKERKIVEEERAEKPQYRPVRLVSDADYNERLAPLAAAEATARVEKVGMWSDAMKEERNSVGFP